MPRVSLEVGYNRRYFHWREAAARAPSPTTCWSVRRTTTRGPSTLRVDSRLPDGGGYPITIYTITAAASARGATNYITLETDFGPERTDYWHGVDVTVNARLRNQLNLQAGTSTGRAVTDNCATTVLIDSPDPRNCRSVEPFLTTLRGSAVVHDSEGRRADCGDAALAARHCSRHGVAVGNGAQLERAEHGRAAAARSSAAGALATGTTTVALLDTDHRLYGPRRNQIDMRFAKIVRFRNTRTNVGVDLGNLLNSNQATAYQSQYDYVQPNGGSWLDPTTILQPRFARFSVTFSF